MKKLLLIALLLPGFALACVLNEDAAGTARVGPFYDDTDHVSLEAGTLTLTQADIQILKTGGSTFAQKNDSNACTSAGLGVYNCALNATDTNTAGDLVIMVNESGADPVILRCIVLNDATYDATIGTDDVYATLATASGKIDTAQADLDILTGANGAILNSTQANYAPATAAAVAATDGKVDTLQGTANTIAGYVDTEITAIKAKTDQQTYTKANELDVNVHSINDATIGGDGTDGDKWADVP